MVDVLQRMMRTWKFPSAPTVQARQAPPVRPAKPVPAPRPVPAKRPTPAATTPARPAPATLRPLALYRPCEFCSEQRIKTNEGTWAAAMVELELYGENNTYRRYYACASHYRAAQRDASANGWRIYCQGHRIA